MIEMLWIMELNQFLKIGNKVWTISKYDQWKYMYIHSRFCCLVLFHSIILISFGRNHFTYKFFLNNFFWISNGLQFGIILPDMLSSRYIRAIVNSVCGLTVNFPEFLYNHYIHHLYHRKYYHSRQSRLRNVVKQWSQGVQGQHNQHTCNDIGDCLQHL